MGSGSLPSGRSTSPRLSPSRNPSAIIDFGVEPARDFAPERAQQANVYEAVAEHVGELRKSGHKVVLASYTRGARERLAGLLEDHGLKAQKLADSWQEALGSKTQPALLVLPLDHGFTTPDVAVLTEQDMLGDRLVRRRKKRKAAAAFLEELATLSPGDLVVHADHGIGRYEGLTQIPVSKVPHDCVALEYARGNKLYVPVENIELLTRYGSESEGVTLDSLGGEAWQRRKSRMKERIREIAGELIKTAALRATRPGIIAEPDSSYPQFVDRFPYEETDDQERAIEDVLAGPRGGQADGPAGLRRRRLRQDRGRAARRVRHGDVGQAGRADLPDDPARAPALHEFRRAAAGLPDQGRPPVAAGPGGRGQEDQGRPRRRHGRHRHRHPRAPREEHRVQAARPRHRRRGAAFRGRPQGAAEGAQGRRPRADADRDADPAHAADGDVRACASCR